MPYDVFVAMFVFAAVTAFTPGPNNIMVTASGVNFGFARTIPHLAGILIGFQVMLVACGAGLGALFTAYAPLQYALKIVGAAYMLWLAWKVANARPADDEPNSSARPLTFLQAAAFQWVNPKAWVIAISAIAIYVRPSHWLVDFAILLAVFGLFTILSTATWTGFGVALRGLLRNPRHARIFNLVMAVLLVASIAPMVI
jgi:threonine/homoserine/homoserine lactone efflux protein